SVDVSAVVRTWQRQPPATTVTWFPPGQHVRALVTPRPGSRLSLTTPLRLRFSAPVTTVLHGRRPSFKPWIDGRWQVTDSHTLVFTPRGFGFGFDSGIRLRLPAAIQPIGLSRATRTLTWR